MNSNPPENNSVNHNHHDDLDLESPAVQALDALLASPEETYEQFVNGFTFLKPEDVAGNGNGVAAQSNAASGSNAGSNTQPQTVIQPSNANEDVIEEEVLEEGTKTPSILMRTSETTGGAHVQLDNFVDDEGSELSSNGSESDVDIESASEPYQSSVIDAENIQGHTTSDSDCDRIRYDSTGTPVSDDTIPPLDITAADQNENPDQINPRDMLYPGEIEEQNVSTNAIKKVTHLDISTTPREGYKREETPEEEEENIENCDDVQPFTLDEHFDYDNVVLSQKFTREEREFLAQFRPQAT